MKVAIFGSGGMAKEIIGYLHGDLRYEIAAVVSTEPFNNLDYAAKFQVFAHVPAGIDAYILAVADPTLKQKFVAENADKWVIYAHPSVCISPYAKVGRGTVLIRGAFIEADAVVGRFVTYNVGAYSGHDCEIGDYATFSPYAITGGGSKIGEGVFFGLHAMTIPRVRVVAGTKISAGAVVRRDITEPCTVYGDPAKPRSIT